MMMVSMECRSELSRVEGILSNAKVRATFSWPHTRGLPLALCHWGEGTHLSPDQQLADNKLQAAATITILIPATPPRPWPPPPGHH